MLCKNLDRESIKARLEPLIAVFEETITPNRVELLPNNAYAQNYAWMYSFEKKLKYRVQDLLKTKLTYDQEKTLFGAGGAVSEGLSNAFAHGHKKNGDLDINIWVAVSGKGIGLIISDQGAGFDFEKIMADFSKGNNFFHIAGNGFSTLSALQEIKACYLRGGTELYLLYIF